MRTLKEPVTCSKCGKPACSKCGKPILPLNRQQKAEIKNLENQIEEIENKTKKKDLENQVEEILKNKSNKSYRDWSKQKIEQLVEFFTDLHLQKIEHQDKTDEIEDLKTILSRTQPLEPPLTCYECEIYSLNSNLEYLCEYQEYQREEPQEEV